MLNTILGAFSSGVAASTSSYESIASATGNGSNTTITFSSIPSTYKHLQIRCLSRNVSASSSSGNLSLNFNSDSGANYTRHYIYGDGASVYASGNTGRLNVTVQGGDLSWSASSTYKAVSIVDIIDYASTTKYKTVRSIAGADVNASGYDVGPNLSSALWLNTAAITTIAITSNSGAAFDSTSTFALYGIKG